MVVRHPELVEKARKRAEEARRYRERLNSRPEALAKHLERKRVSSAKANAKRDPNELRAAARERMRRLRSDPAKRAAQRQQAREWRKDPTNAERYRERLARQAAQQKARLQTDQIYRESQNKKSRDYLAVRLQDPEYRKAYTAKNKEYYRARATDTKFLERSRSSVRQWKKSNPDKAREHKRRYRKNPRYRSIQSLRNAVHRATKEGQKRFRSSKYLGIDLRDARQYIESMLRPEWTWDNHGKAWQIDHIFPIAKADLSDPVEVIAVSNYRNLRPLSVAENKAKKDKVTVEAMRLFERLKREAAATLAAAQIRA
jgi:hypothetical protein